MKSKASYFVYIFCIALCMYILTHFFYQLCPVVGDSMSPACNSGSLLLIQKFQFKDKLSPNDIIVIRHPAANQTIVKRIIALPGDTISICGGIVYVNNQPFQEAYALPPIEDAGNAATPITLSPNEYFVLGDNRNSSIDSRFDEIGIINFSYIQGKALYIFNAN